MENVSSSNGQEVNVPKLRFPEFEGEWQKDIFSNIFELHSNNTLSRAELSSDGDIRNIHYGDILVKYGDVVSIKEDEIPFVSPASTARRNDDFLQNGDIIIADTAEDATAGKVIELSGIEKENVVAGLHTIPCRPLQKYADGYLGIYLNSPSYHNRLYPLMQGIKVTSIGKSAISTTTMFYPSETEQKKIASFILKLNNKITLQRKLIDALKSYKRGVTSKIFDKELSLCPKEFSNWKTVQFGDIIEEYSDRTKEENEDILLSAAIEGMFLNSELFDHERGSSNKGYKKISKGTLILSTQNLHLGNANVNMRFEHGIISPAYKTYNIVGCNHVFLAHWVKRPETKHFFYNATTVGASVCRRNVDWSMLYSFNIEIPDIEEQIAIVQFLNTIDKRILLAEKLLEQLQSTKKSLLSDLFI